jgi:protocatechuate 3,4-dioxygenase beta subunit
MGQTDDRLITRRALALGLAGASALAATGVRAAGLAQTPEMALGPFYPIERPLDADADLTRLKGRTGRAKGQIIEVAGRVLGPDGKPQANATLEVWQCNAAGRYAHPGDTTDAPLDPGFQGYARLTADADGAFRFLTVMPGDYPAGQFMRARHIHFDVSGKHQRIVTQMYLPNTEAMLAQDRVFQRDLERLDEGERARIFGSRVPGGSTAESGADRYLFDVVLNVA